MSDATRTGTALIGDACQSRWWVVRGSDKPGVQRRWVRCVVTVAYFGNSERWSDGVPLVKKTGWDASLFVKAASLCNQEGERRATSRTAEEN